VRRLAPASRSGAAGDGAPVAPAGVAAVRSAPTRRRPGSTPC
jgi:hypothetical protein